MSTPTCNYFYIVVFPPPAGDKVHSASHYNVAKNYRRKILILEQQFIATKLPGFALFIQLFCNGCGQEPGRTEIIPLCYILLKFQFKRYLFTIFLNSSKLFLPNLYSRMMPFLSSIIVTGRKLSKSIHFSLV